MAPANDGMQKQNPQGYNIQQLMAQQRYPRQGGAPSFPGGFPQPNLPTGAPPGTDQQQQRLLQQLQIQRHQMQFQQMQQQQHQHQQHQQQQQHHQQQAKHSSSSSQVQQRQHHRQKQQQSSGGSTKTSSSQNSRSKSGSASSTSNVYQGGQSTSSSSSSAHSKASTQQHLPSASSRPTPVPPASSAAASSSSSASTAAPTPSSAASSSGTSSSKKDSSQRSSATSASSASTNANNLHQKQLLSQCDWKDKALWASRQVFGGNSINGFLRATATSQRIKKQRARQLALTRKSAAAAAAAASGGSSDKPAAEEEKKDTASNKKAAFDQVAEEQLKKDIMNPRTAKKIKAELEAGVQFCVTLHNIFRRIIIEVDHNQGKYLPPPLKHEGEIPMPLQSPSKSNASVSNSTSKQVIPSPTPPHQAAQSAGSGSARAPGGPAHPPAAGPAGGPSPSIATSASTSSSLPARASGNTAKTKQNVQQSPSTSQALPNKPSKPTASPGNPGSSTLRKQRKKKLPPSNEPPVKISEFDGSGKRIVTKKEHTFRIFEVLRFRALKEGDFVAARVSSRDLWILARVLKDFASFSMSPEEFLRLSEARRDAVFRDKVLVKDVEEKEDSGATQVTRNLILPLPRTYSEAADWGQRCKKGSRVYAMYPQTTSLYSATVIDNTTYCRDDDDIIVVEFDGEEPDASGLLPKYHIPARFVTLIPREFPAAQSNTAGNKNSKRKSASSSSILPPGPSAKRGKGQGPTQTDDALNDMLSEMAYGGFPGSPGSLENFDQLDLNFNKPLPPGKKGEDTTQLFMTDLNRFGP